MATADLLVVVVLYDTTISHAAAWQSLLAMGRKPAAILLFDNSPHAQAPPASPVETSYVHHPENAGVSAAYNEAFRRAQQLGLPWIMLADQDTNFPLDLLEMFTTHVTEHDDVAATLAIDQQGPVSPFRFRHGRGHRIGALSAGKHSLLEYRMINSGTFLRTTAFATTGGYDERLPLDFADIEFQDRLSRHVQTFRLLPCEARHHLAAASKAPTAVVLRRFRQYRTGAQRYGSITGQPWRMAMNVLARALVLSVNYRTIAFLRAAFETPRA